MTHTALIIDDEADIRELIAMSLERIGLETHTATNLEEARNLLQTYHFDVCLTDMRLPDGNGVEFVKEAIGLQANLPVAVITAHGHMNSAIDAMKNGAFDFVTKPVNLNSLRQLVQQAIRVHDHSTNESASTAVNSSEPLRPYLNEGPITQGVSLDQNREVSTPSASLSPNNLIGYDRLIGNSAPIQNLRSMIAKVARTNAPVWITGESGTGKELIARLIHENGPRSDGPFIAINCGAIPNELMESEMFGHRKGSFTGAHSHHDGLFKQAEKGTLFLDEVAELPLHMQVKLLRVIQERSYRPVGSSDEFATDVRILSASHADLAVEVDANRFRHDLYYRLNVICIRAPSLRERVDDIINIANHILTTLSVKENLDEPMSLSHEASSAMLAYSFPGNVRELENILERAIVLSDGKVIDIQDLNIEPMSPRQAASTTPTFSVQTTLPVKSPTKNHGVHAESQIILNMLNQTQWNRKLAAERLGLTYRQLRYRIKLYALDSSSTDK